MPDLLDGETVEVQGSSGRYQLKNVGGVYSCSCPAWRNQSLGIEKRTCKHLRAYRGDEAETARIGTALPAPRKFRVAGAGGEAATETQAPPVLLAHVWENDFDPVGWWMSEKLDGVRAYWDGTQFISRLGNIYLAPDWFVQGLPQVPLDGELWHGRKMFQHTTSIVRRTDKSDGWKKIAYLVFDAPAEKGPFEDRIELCRSYFDKRPAPHARWHEHERCRGLDHLREELARVEALGGEGLMLRKPGSRYEVGRSHTLLKVKTFHDAEARVVQHLPGAGKHSGRLGALLVEMPDGTRFSVGTGFSDAERDSPPPIGAIITYRFQELSDGGVPRFPSWVGVRHDVAFASTETRVATRKRSAAPLLAAEPKAAPAAAAFAASARSTAAAAPAAPGRSALADDEPASLVALRIIAGRALARPPSPASKTAAAPAPPAPARAAAAAATPPPRPAGHAGRRYFEYQEGSSSKFWEIEVTGKTHVVRFGRIGSEGQKRVKSFADEHAARRDAQDLIAEKTHKGYAERRQ